MTFSTSQPDWPAIVISLDRVVSKDAQYPKTWLIHSIQEPAVEGNTISIVRDGPTWDGSGDYGGKLVVQSLLPQDAVLKKVGGPGKEFWVESTQTNYAVTKAAPAEPGAWRVEVSPGAAALEDTFLHAMVVTPSGSDSPAKALMIREHGMVGASLAGWIALFSDTGSLLSSGQIDVTAGSGHHVLACDLQPGWWSVKKQGAIITSQWVTEEAKSLYFEAGEGEYVLEPGDPPDGSAPTEAGADAAIVDGQASQDGAAGAAGAADAQEDSGGCGCRTASRSPAPVAGLMALALVAGLARSRRRSLRGPWFRSSGNP